MSDTPDTPLPGANPAPFGPPTLPPPVVQAVAVPRQKARSGAIIAAVVGVVAGGGAVAGLLNVARADDGGDDKAPIVIAQPAPTAPAVPGAGTVPVPVTLPGPSVQPPVTTVAPATIAPDDTTAPGGGIQPPPGSGSTDETTPETAPPVATGDTVTMSDGIAFAVPDGWELLTSNETFAAISNGSASIYVNLVADVASASDVLFRYQEIVTGSVDSAEFTDVSTAEIYSNQVVDAAAFGYRGYVGQGQSGSTPVRGTVFGDLRVDGLAIVTDVMYVPGDDGEITESDNAGISAFFGSFQYGE